MKTEYQNLTFQGILRIYHVKGIVLSIKIRVNIPYFLLFITDLAVHSDLINFNAICLKKILKYKLKISLVFFFFI